jgi:CheY-like chemotaxis protein
LLETVETLTGKISMSYKTRQTVLLIEQDQSLRRLMALGLQYRGMRVVEATSPAHLPDPDSEEQPPDLLLLDIDGGVNSDLSLLTTIQAHPYLSTLPMVLLAWENVLLGPADEQLLGEEDAGDHKGPPYRPSSTLAPTDLENTAAHRAQAHIACLTKPFDARALYTTIEQLLLENTSAPEAANATLAAQEVLLLAKTTSPAPSIWPVITAAALLLTFIGLMVHITITILGLVIFLIALLGWTLDCRLEKPSCTQLGT